MTAVSRAFITAAFLLGTLTGCAGDRTTSGPGVADTSTPGWTGRTLVAGSNSTLAGNATATEMQQKWQITPTR